MQLLPIHRAGLLPALALSATVPAQAIYTYHIDIQPEFGGEDAPLPYTVIHHDGDLSGRGSLYEVERAAFVPGAGFSFVDSDTTFEDQPPIPANGHPDAFDSDGAGTGTLISGQTLPSVWMHFSLSPVLNFTGTEPIGAELFFVEPLSGNGTVDIRVFEDFKASPTYEVIGFDIADSPTRSIALPYELTSTDGDFFATIAPSQTLPNFTIAGFGVAGATFTVTPVPEPTTCALFTGGAALAFLTTRKLKFKHL